MAKLVGKDHSKLLRDIRGYCEHLNESNFGLVDFFVESTYQDDKGETRPCYLITRRGCDMIANKLTGRKGVLFTAAYTTKFEKMENFIKNGHGLGNGVSLPELVESLEVVANGLRMNDAGRVKMYHDLYGELGLPTGFLPAYVDSKPKFSATALLDKCDFPMRAVEFNRRLLAQGFLEQKTRPSTKGDKVRKFWSVTEKGRKYGENQTSPNNPRETQPLWYEDTFGELYGLVTS